MMVKRLKSFYLSSRGAECQRRCITDNGQSFMGFVDGFQRITIALHQLQRMITENNCKKAAPRRAWTFPILVHFERLWVLSWHRKLLETLVVYCTQVLMIRHFWAQTTKCGPARDWSKKYACNVCYGVESLKNVLWNLALSGFLLLACRFQKPMYPKVGVSIKFSGRKMKQKSKKPEHNLNRGWVSSFLCVSASQEPITQYASCSIWHVKNFGYDEFLTSKIWKIGRLLT